MSIRVLKDKMGRMGVINTSLLIGAGLSLIGSLAAIVYSAMNTRVTSVEAKVEVQASAINNTNVILGRMDERLGNIENGLGLRRTIKK